MLDHEGRENMWTILQALDAQWDDDCELESIENLPAPYSEFEILLRLYGEVEVSIAYERGTLDTAIMQNGECIPLELLTEKPVFIGLQAMKYKNMKHNFEILDEVARGMIAQ
jgi:hypothetical protein